MPRPYSTDLRERVLLAWERGEGGQGEIARRFRVRARTVSGWLRLVREEGRRAPKPMGCGRLPAGGEQEALRELVAEQNDATLAEYADRRAARTGTRRSPLALCRALRRLGLPRKKTLRAAEQDRPDIVEARVRWRDEMAGIASDRLVFIDESGIDTRLGRAYARAARGKRVLGKMPWGHWKRLTVIGALAHDGVVASMSIAATTSTAVFQAFVEPVLIPALRERSDAVVVMDNLAPHKGRAGPSSSGRGQDPVPLPAGLLARSEPDRALPGEAEGLAAGQGRPRPGGAGA